MDIMLIILIIILLYIFVARPIIREHRKIRNAFYQNMRGTDDKSNWNYNAAQSQQRKKVFSENDGEYVDFEEIKDENTTKEEQN